MHSVGGFKKPIYRYTNGLVKRERKPRHLDEEKC